MTMLTRRAALLVGMESVYDTAPSLSGATDAVLIENPSFSPDIMMLERKFLRPSLSRLSHVTGRKLAKFKFSAELTTTGRTNSGSSADAPVISRLIRACGMDERAGGANVLWGAPTPVNVPTGSPAVSWSSSSTTTVSDATSYLITITTAGPSGTARANIVSNSASLDTTIVNAVMTSGGALTIGSMGIAATPTFAGALVVGMSWVVAAFPAGIMYLPKSNNFESCTLKFYVDGSYHLMTGCYGTFQIKADAGKFATIDFDMMGRYRPYADEALPTNLQFSEAPPPVFQSATLALGAIAPTIASLTLDLGVTVTPRDDANAADGYLGMIITDRMVKGGLDPESVTAVTTNYWEQFANGTPYPLICRIGTTPGNRVIVYCPSVQTSQMSYTDRAGVRAHSLGLGMNSGRYDDELILYMS